MRHALSLDAIRVLQAIDNSGTFAKAAESLFKVPSAITYTMQKLEADLGVALFDRRGKRAVLTPAGKLLLDEGLAILTATARLEDKIQQLESGWETNLVIARDTIVTEPPLMQLIAQFCQLNKPVGIRIIEEVLGGGWDALHSHRADIALGVTGEIPKGQFHVHQMGEVEFVFAVAASHPLADEVGVIDSQHINQYPAIVVADSSRILPGRTSGVFANQQQIRVYNMASKIQAQVMGIGVGFLPLHMVRQHLQTGQLVAKACDIPRPKMPVYCAWEKSKNGQALSWFAEAIKQATWF